MSSPRGARDARASPEGRLLAGLIALKLDPSLAAPLLKYLGELVIWNKAYNLTSVRDPAEMVTRHLLDSLAVLPLAEGRVLDVGTGAGLPGIPLALANPALNVTLLDSTGKKTRFLRHAQRQIPLTNVEIVEARAEAFTPPARYDTVISRAFGSLAEFCRAAGRLCAPGGRLVAMKGKLDEKEIAAIPAGIELKERRRLTVPGLDEDRHAVILAPRAPASSP